MTQIKTPSGFEAEVDERRADDLAFVELIYRTEDNDVRAFNEIAKTLLEKEEYEKLLQHIRTEDGRTPISSLIVEVTEIIKGLNSTKK